MVANKFREAGTGVGGYVTQVVASLGLAWLDQYHNDIMEGLDLLPAPSFAPEKQISPNKLNNNRQSSKMYLSST